MKSGFIIPTATKASAGVNYFAAKDRIVFANSGFFVSRYSAILMFQENWADKK